MKSKDIEHTTLINKNLIVKSYNRLKHIFAVSNIRAECKSSLNFGSYFDPKAQIARKRLGIIRRVKQYFTLRQLLDLYVSNSWRH